MSEEKLNNKQIQAYLKKLHAGTLTSQEQWQLERASLDDPFLEEALEGFYDNQGEHSPSLALLKDKINITSESKPRRRILPYKWMSMAAAIALLLGVSLWLFY